MTAVNPTRAGAGRIGRPPGADGAATRRRILGVARVLFAERGYLATSMRDIAAGAELTPGAVYHYFKVKRDIYVAVFDEVQSTIVERFAAAVDPADRFVDQLKAVLDAAAAIYEEDHTLAEFLAAVPVETRYHDEIRHAVQQPSPPSSALVREVVAAGVERGELADDVDPETVVQLLMAILSGLVRMATNTRDPKLHTAVINAFELLLDGQLVKPGGARRDA